MAVQENNIFCTLFDSNYLDKGLALYYSMRMRVQNFKLYIFAFDQKCYDILCDLHLQNVQLFSVMDIMTDELQEKKLKRTRAEFCWTCTSVIIEYVLLQCQEKICTYIDADIYFYGDPDTVIAEIIDDHCSVGLVAHGFERDYGYGNEIFHNGKYCVQFNTFINDKAGLLVLEEWKKECLEWCYSHYEDGRLGDQKYLDKWQLKYSGIHESKNLGAGVAPWNLHLYHYVGIKDGEIWFEYGGDKFPVIFYHYEGMKYLKGNKAYLNLWKPESKRMKSKVKILYGEYFKVVGLIRKYLSKTYGIFFDHMVISDDYYVEEKGSLRNFCRNYGIFDGIRHWWAYWRTDIMSVAK